MKSSNRPDQFARGFILGMRLQASCRSSQRTFHLQTEHSRCLDDIGYCRGSIRFWNPPTATGNKVNTTSLQSLVAMIENRKDVRTSFMPSEHDFRMSCIPNLSNSQMPMGEVEMRGHGTLTEPSQSVQAVQSSQLRKTQN